MILEPGVGHWIFGFQLGLLSGFSQEDAVISNFKNIQNVDWGTLADTMCCEWSKVT